MDTKSIRSDRYFIVKLLCILLSMILAFVPSVCIFDLMFYADSNYNGDQILRSLMSSDYKDDPFRLDALSGRLYAYKDIVYTKAKYPSNSDENYEKYKAEKEAELRDKYIRNLKHIIIAESTEKVPYYTLSALEKGYISIEKLDGTKHKCYNKKGFTFTRYDKNNRDYYDTKLYGNVSRDSYRNNITYSYYLSSKIVHGALNRLSQAELNDIDLVTRICSCVYKGQKLDDYYTVKINADAIDVNNAEFFIIQNTKGLPTRQKFEKLLKENDEDLSRYKSIRYALIDKNGKIISSSFNKKLDTLQKIEEKYSRREYYCCIDENSNYSSLSNNFAYTLDSSGHDFNDLQYIGKVIFFFNPQHSGSEDNLINSYKSILRTEGMTEDLLKVCLPCLALIIIMLVVLCIFAGRREKNGDIYMSYFDKIPAEIKFLLNIGLIFGIGCLGVLSFFGFARHSPSNWRSSPLALVVTFAASSLMILLFIDFVLYFARHIKNRDLFSRFIPVMIITSLSKRAKKRREKREASRIEKKEINRLRKEKIKEALILASDTSWIKDMILKGIFLVAVPNILVSTIASLAYLENEELFGISVLVLLLIYDAVLIILTVRSAISIKHIFDSLHSIRIGDREKKIDILDIPKFARVYADDVNCVGEGMRVAIEKAVKEQKTKTELITNVSHDLKTPLTSVINYVDLLSKCDIKDENALKYIAVLGEKSNRLKKLIEDLIEASKASAGNIRVELVKISLRELVAQSVGEYEDEFTKRNLTVVIDGEGDFPIIADSRLSYRVLDNLLVNVRKYTLPGTRVYVKLTSEEKMSFVTIINVSEQQLNIPAEELIKRFVRGDKSRSTEGSGLGLSIAKSFAELQGGSLSIDINGDLFTAKVGFRKV